MKRYRVPIQIALAATLVIGVVLGIFGPHIAEWALSILEWVDGLGKLGRVAMVAAFVLFCTVSLPGLPLTLGCGFLFGVTEGTLVATVGSSIGAAVAFVLARTVGRKWIRSKIGKKVRFRRLDRASRAHGFTIVLLTRLSPVFPFNLLNYVYGLTSVHFRDYFAATVLGVVPVTILYVYVGTAMKTLADIAAGNIDPKAIDPWVPAIGFLLTAGAVIFLATLAKRLLGKALAPLEPRGFGEDDGTAPAIEDAILDDEDLNEA